MTKRTVPFVKYSATGNDFIVVDNRKSLLPDASALFFARRACLRAEGIGADGLILLERSRRADAKMRIINADGSEAEMCGNGSRALAHFAFYAGCPAKKSMEIETLAGLIRASVTGKDTVRVRLTEPSGLNKGIKINCAGKKRSGHFLNTGVPHFVVFVKDLDGVDVPGEGRCIRHHAFFRPYGTNVDFAQVMGRGLVRVRTYERGVEDETGACGTGSTASAILGVLTQGLALPVRVRTRSGETLKVHFTRKGDAVTNVFLEGRVRPVFRGSVLFDGRNLFPSK